MPDTTTTTDGNSFTVRLVGWTDMNHGVRALLFGHMVKLAMPVVREYLSDLYHDAQWLEENVQGPREFDFLVRPSGTNIAESARTGVSIGAGETARFYRVRVFEQNGRQHDGEWFASFTRVPLGDVATLPAPWVFKPVTPDFSFGRTGFIRNGVMTYAI